MVRDKKDSNLRRVPETIYFKCVNPIACQFGEIVFNLHTRMIVSMIFAFIISLFSQVQPISVNGVEYTTFIEFLIRPSLLLKTFSFQFLVVPALYTFIIMFVIWLAIFSLFSMIQKTGKLHELILPVLTVIIFAYILFLISGSLGPLFLHTGLVECIEDTDCIKAGYVGEVCASVYRPVYSEYSPDLQALTTCGCLENKCVGS